MTSIPLPKLQTAPGPPVPPAKSTPAKSWLPSIRPRHFATRPYKPLIPPRMSRVSFQVQTNFSGTGKIFCLNILSLGLFCIVIVFVQAGYSAEWRSKRGLGLNTLLRTGESTTISVVQASQVILLALTTVALAEAFECLIWASVGTINGLPYLSFLALSPSTDYQGTLAIAFARPWSEVQVVTRIWGLLKAFLTCCTWVSGLILFLNTSSITVYDTRYSQSVTAGLGPFNGSLVGPFLTRLQSLAPPGQAATVLPYTYFSMISTLVTNPLITTESTTTNCSSSKCHSYLITGGLELVAPWVTEERQEYSMVRIDNAPSVQLDVEADKDHVFADEDCDIFGAENVIIGIKLCISRDSADPGRLKSGIFLCPEGIDNDSCQGFSPFFPRRIVQTTFSTRQATFIAARSNYSIISILDKSTPAPYVWSDFDLSAYRQVFRWVLNFTAADLPAPSSIATYFWNSREQFLSDSTSGMLDHNINGLLAFPFWLFNLNNYGNIEIESNTTIPGLPSEFYTHASLVNPFKKVHFNMSMFILYLFLQTQSMMFIWGVLIWTGLGRNGEPLLKRSEFSILDVTTKTRATAHAGKQRPRFHPYTTTGEAIKTMKDFRLIAA